MERYDQEVCSCSCIFVQVLFLSTRVGDEQEKLFFPPQQYHRALAIEK